MLLGERKLYIFPVVPIVLNISMDGLSEKIENAPQQVFEGPMLIQKNRRVSIF